MFQRFRCVCQMCDDENSENNSGVYYCVKIIIYILLQKFAKDHLEVGWTIFAIIHVTKRLNKASINYTKHHKPHFIHEMQKKP